MFGFSKEYYRKNISGILRGKKKRFLRSFPDTLRMQIFREYVFQELLEQYKREFSKKYLRYSERHIKLYFSRNIHIFGTRYHIYPRRPLSNSEYN